MRLWLPSSPDTFSKLAEHFDRFCRGRHPLFPGFVMDGSDGGPDYRVRFRCSENSIPASHLVFRSVKGYRSTVPSIGMDVSKTSRI